MILYVQEEKKGRKEGKERGEQKDEERRERVKIYLELRIPGKYWLDDEWDDCGPFAFDFVNQNLHLQLNRRNIGKTNCRVHVQF